MASKGRKGGGPDVTVSRPGPAPKTGPSQNYSGYSTRQASTPLGGGSGRANKGGGAGVSPGRSSGGPGTQDGNARAASVPNQGGTPGGRVDSGD